MYGQECMADDSARIFLEAWTLKQIFSREAIMTVLTEWKLDKNIFQRLSQEVFSPEIELFASRLNCQVKPFISWHHPDPESFAVDTFAENWGRWMIYAFPPFSLILCWARWRGTRLQDSWLYHSGQQQYGIRRCYDCSSRTSDASPRKECAQAGTFKCSSSTSQDTTSGCRSPREAIKDLFSPFHVLYLFIRLSLC